MMNKKTIADALAKIGATDEQKAAFLEHFGGKSPTEISESDVAAELEKLGIPGRWRLWTSMPRCGSRISWIRSLILTSLKP